MLKKMRHRVILASMLAFFAVIMLVAVLVNIVDYCVVTGRLDQTTERIIKQESGEPERPMSGFPMPPFMELPDMEANYMNRFFVVRYDGEGNLLSTSTDHIASVDNSEAEKYGMKIMSGSKDHGYLKTYRYGRQKAGDGTVIVFLNAGRELQFLHTLGGLTFVISLAALLLVFILVVPMSRRAIRPIEDNIQRQKRFITDASHELKTPLTSINTSLDVLEMEGGDNEWIDNIRKQSGRMSRLVGELVALSRLDEDNPLPDKEEFSLGNAAWEIVEVHEAAAKNSGKKLSVDIDEDIHITGDKSAIQQMFSVLLDNAIRYSEPGGEIRFCICRKKGKAVAEVFNTCDYKEPPDTERLFDRFYRPDESRNTETGGSGVGLAIAKAVAEAHGGTISASCPSGKTMTIKVVL